MVERRETPDADARAMALRPEELPSKNRGLANVACVVGAALGAFVWVTVATLMHEHYGLVAIPVGALVGGACAWAGGRGNQMALVAALFALVSIVGGKLVAAERAIAAEFEAERCVSASEVAPSFDEWSAREASSRTVRRRILYNMHGLDVLSGALGIALAFSIVMRASRADIARLRGHA